MSLSHWLIVGVVVLLVFGPKRLSEVGTGLGEGIRNFKKGLNGEGNDKPESPSDQASTKS
ncbi:MAG TPA: twin-arginine translocase TatA/TatE family subunit [Polyangiaceae bacterium]|nr:twin-arginine translocase TatA/TatE family subunit [Polyangiaceae bacterium]